MDPANTIVKVTTTYGLQFDITSGEFKTTQEAQTVEILPREDAPPVPLAARRKPTPPK